MKKTSLLGALALIAPFSAFSETTINTDKVIVSASRFAEAVTSQSVGVEIITAEDIASSQAQSLPQLLSRYAGIYSRDNSATADRQIDLRGFGMNGDQNTTVVLDGQRLNENELVTIKWSSIPLDSIERIEVLRGSGAVLYGGGATGGVIHIITKKPAIGTNTGYAGLSFGSFNNRQLNAGINTAVEQAGLGLHFNHQDTNGYRDNSGRRQDNLEGNMTLGFLPFGTEVKFGVAGQHPEMAGARSAAQLDTDRRGATTPQDWADRDGWHASLLTSGFVDKAEWNIDLGYRHNRRSSFQKGYYDPSGATHTILETESDVISFSPRLKIPSHLAGMENSLVLGFDYEDWQYESNRDSSGLFPSSASIEASQQNRSLYLLDRLSMTPTTQFSMGGRVQNVHYKGDDKDNLASYARGSRDETQHAWEAGLRHDVLTNTTLFAKAGGSFRFATLDEIYNQYGGPLFDSAVTFLKPQSSNEQEIGIESSFDSGKVRMSFYKIRLDNEIHYLPIASSNINLPPSERKGLELSGEKNFAGFLTVRANYTLASSHFLSGDYSGTSVKGKEVPLVPRHRANLDLEWTVNEATRLSVATQLVGNQRLDNDQANQFFKKIPGYSTTDLSLEHTSGPWVWRGAVHNLFDRKYYTYGVSSTTPGSTNFNAYPEPERTFFLSGTYRWQ